MKTKLLRGLAAATLAMAIGVGGTAKPVQAVSPLVWVDLAINVVNLLRGGGSSDAALRAAVQEIKAAIEQTKTDIIAHTDAIGSDPSGAPIVAFWRYYECVAYNGDKAMGKEFQIGGTIREPRINRPAVQAEAARNTSRPIAIDAIPKIRVLLP